MIDIDILCGNSEILGILLPQKRRWTVDPNNQESELGNPVLQPTNMYGESSRMSMNQQRTVESQAIVDCFCMLVDRDSHIRLETSVRLPTTILRLGMGEVRWCTKNIGFSIKESFSNLCFPKPEAFTYTSKSSFRD